MSRARDWRHPDTGQLHWFNSYGLASNRELELLADVEGVEIDDLIDANISSHEVLWRLNKFSNLIPQEVLERKRKRRERVYVAPTCRICPMEGRKCEGRVNRHHFVPRWLMLELENYVKYSPRTFCTIPVCILRHRELHRRGEQSGKSIVPFLNAEERKLANHLISSLKRERPAIFDLIASGKGTYEYQLIRDYQLGLFRDVTLSNEVARPEVEPIAVGEG